MKSFLHCLLATKVVAILVPGLWVYTHLIFSLWKCLGLSLNAWHPIRSRGRVWLELWFHSLHWPLSGCHSTDSRAPRGGAIPLYDFWTIPPCRPFPPSLHVGTPIVGVLDLLHWDNVLSLYSFVVQILSFFCLTFQKIFLAFSSCLHINFLKYSTFTFSIPQSSVAVQPENNPSDSRDGARGSVVGMYRAGSRTWGF